jgi:alkylhydroperoxidase family enzyme
MGVRGPAWRAFVEQIRTTSGHLPAPERAAALDATAAPGSSPAGVVEEFVAKVAERSYAVTDGDVTRLRESGMSEDKILELVVAASVGAGDRRWRAVYRQ